MTHKKFNEKVKNAKIICMTGKLKSFTLYGIKIIETPYEIDLIYLSVN